MSIVYIVLSRVRYRRSIHLSFQYWPNFYFELHGQLLLWSKSSPWSRNNGKPKPLTRRVSQIIIVLDVAWCTLAGVFERTQKWPWSSSNEDHITRVRFRENSSFWKRLEPTPQTISVRLLAFNSVLLQICRHFVCFKGKIVQLHRHQFSLDN